jgi:hypothetical protein
VTAQASPDGTVAVSSGSYRIGGSTKTCAGGTVSVISGSANPDGSTSSAADANYYRYDLIVADSSSHLGVLHGTVPAPAWPDYSVNPVFPTVTVAYAVLAAILIPPTASGITTLASTTIVPKNLAISADAFHDQAHSLTGTNHTGMTKGGINVGTGADTSTILAVGTNTHVLTADSTQTSGTKWAAPAAGLATDTLWAAKGDIVTATANDTAAVVSVGTNNYNLVADSTVAAGVSWQPSRHDITLPTGYIAQTVPRNMPLASSITISTGKLHLQGIYLPTCTVTNIIVAGGGAAVAPTHWWFALYNSSRTLLSQTADQLTAAWGADTIKTLALGSAQAVTAGWYYIGFMMTAGTIVGSIYSWPAMTNLTAIAPVLGGDTTDTGLTTTAPSTAAAPAASTVVAYRAVS